ncbi:MAG: SH3 domain-containing protein [Pleurocapsa minor GSE-CHR-MK-17-07R]|jgi:hypothetical protein|nr:SH3 domain-containing protein [Pleurocapsa minor GSE-CHR-MK 17-07R]
MFGLNILANTTDKAEAVDAIRLMRPRVVLVMDDLAWAVGLAAKIDALVIHRAYRPDDHELDLKTRPADFVSTLRPYNNIAHQVLNEPDGHNPERVPGLMAWLADVMQLAASRGIRLCVGNFGLSQPDPVLVNSGMFDLLLHELARHRGQHVLGLHEYFNDQPLREPNHIGRLEIWNARAARLGLPPPPIVLTEVGRDVAGGYDGWRAAGWSDADYASRLILAASVWRRFPNVIGACIFSHGPGFNRRWQTYNVQGALNLRQILASDNNRDYPAPGPNWNFGTPRDALIKAPPTGARFRSLPSLNGTILDVLRTGDAVVIYPNISPPLTGYTWYKLEHDGRTGYVASSIVSFVEPQTPPPPVPDIWKSTRSAALAMRQAAQSVYENAPSRDMRDKAQSIMTVADEVLRRLE